jgi:hypothetical protein
VHAPFAKRHFHDEETTFMNRVSLFYRLHCAQAYMLLILNAGISQLSSKDNVSLILNR